MARYLLNAPDEDMAKWKLAAGQSGMSLAAWMREKLMIGFYADTGVPEEPEPDEDLLPEAGGEYEIASVELKTEQTKPFVEVSMPRLNSLTFEGKKNFRPDPKPIKGKKKR